MRKMMGMSFITLWMLSFCFVLPGLTQETKEAEGVYTIKKGDTLWDISSKFLKDPFLWPKLWEINPYITNPHWIYPGNQIQLSGQEPVKKEEPKKVVEEKPKEVVKEPEAIKPEVKKAEAPSLPPVEKKPEVVAEAKAPKVQEKPVGWPEIRSAGFMSAINYKGVGVVVASKEGKNLMSEGDIIYLSFKTSESVLIGDKYTIFRAIEGKMDYIEKKVGMIYSIIGNVQIIDQKGNFLTAKVIESFYAIRRGDYAHPYSKEKMEGIVGK